MNKTKIILISTLAATSIVAATILVPKALKQDSEEPESLNIRSRPITDLTQENHPTETVEFAKLLRDAFLHQDHDEIKRLARILAEKDIDKALALILAMKSDWINTRSYILACADVNPQAVAEWSIDNLPKGGTRSFSLRNALWKWTHKDFNAALEWSKKLSSEADREPALRAIFEALASTNPETAAQQIMKIDNFKTRGTAIASILQYWVKEDLHAATEWAWKLPEGAERNTAMASIARMLANSNDPIAMEWAKRLPPSHMRDSTIRGIASLLATENDLESAAKWITGELPGGSGMNAAFQIRIAEWTLKSPNEAITWASQLLDPVARDEAFSIILQALAISDPAAAAAMIDKLEDGKRKTDTISRIYEKWCKKDPEAANIWIKDQPDEIAQIAKDSINNDYEENKDIEEPVPTATEPEESKPEENIEETPEIFWPELRELIASLPDGEQRTSLIHTYTIAQASEDNDPDGAIAYLREQLPPGHDRDFPVKVIIKNDITTHPDKMQYWSNWSLSQDPEQDRNAAVYGTLNGIAENYGTLIGIAKKSSGVSQVADFEKNTATLLDAITVGPTRNRMITFMAFKTAHIIGTPNWSNQLSRETDQTFAQQQIDRF